MSETSIRALIFDYGGVKTAPQDINFFKNIIQNLGIDRNRFLDS